MGITREEFQQRLIRKSVWATEDWQASFLWTEDGRVGQVVHGRRVAFVPVDKVEVEVEEDVSGPAYWKGGRPVCEVTPAQVDHRIFQSAVRDQLDRATCASFAILAGMESILIRSLGWGLDLSEQFANWLVDRDNCLDRIALQRAAAELQGKRVCEERFLPYQDRGEVTNGDCLAAPGRAAGNNAIFGIGACRSIRRLDGLEEFQGPSIANSDYLECIMSQGSDIVFSTEAVWVDSPEVIDVRLESLTREPVRTRAFHAMLMVGYDREREYVLCKNSMGQVAGERGYYKLSYDYIRAYVRNGLIIESVQIGPRPVS